VPKLRFPEFRGAEAWEQKEVGEVFQVTRGDVLAMTLVQDEKTEATPYPVYSSQTKKNGLSGFYSEYLFADAITWTTDGANAGDVNFRAGKFFCTNVCGVLLSPKGFANPCIAALLNSVARKYVSYVGNPKLMNGVMSKIPIPLPPLSEQQKIAECLSSVDEVIAAQARKVDALKTHKKGLMQKLFPREGETQPRLRFPEFRNDGVWGGRTLADIAEISSGTTPSRSNMDFFNEGTIPWVKTTDLNNSFITMTEEYITPKARARINPIGSVLIAMYGGFKQIGRTGCLNMPAATNQALSVLVLDKDIASPVYVLAWLNAKVDVWKRIASSSRKDPNITGSDIAKFPISLPALPEQQRIAACLSSFDTLITAETEKLETLKRHKRGLMQQLFPSPVEAEA
jgi:type I restriction enzyme S subunit